MTDPELTVHKIAYYQPVELLGLDEQGRQLYRCPSRGCGETAYFDEEGKGHCPAHEAASEYLSRVMADLEARGDLA